MLEFWIVIVQGNAGQDNYHQHVSEHDAKIEADRLANLPSNRGRRVFVMKSVGYCQSPETPQTWHEMDQIPF